MKKTVSFIVLVALLFTCSFSYAGTDVLWSKYTAADGSISFHYPNNPAGWKAEMDGSTITIENPKTGEELLMAMIPYDKAKAPTALAADFIALLKEGGSGLTASNWKTEPKTKNIRVTFELADKQDNKQYKGSGIVVKENQQAIWFSYLAPASGYSSQRGLLLLQGFIGSLASGSGSKAPDVNYNTNQTARNDVNAKAFLFVLEFALGAPFTASQEQLILGEVKNSWRNLPEKELAKYDQYPGLVKTIMKLGQKDLEELRSELEKTTREWIDESPASDKVVKLVKGQLQAKGKKVIDGNPPLTEMSLTAYSEILAYSRMLSKNSKATPEQISQTTVNEIKKQVKDVWSTYSVEEKKQIATSPGLWMCIRTVLRNGTKADQDSYRTSLLKIAATEAKNEATNKASETTAESETTKKPMSMAAHNTLMAMQQTTFNTYMWSRGFNYLPSTGKMW